MDSDHNNKNTKQNSRNKSQTTEINQPKISAKNRAEIKDLVAELVKQGILENRCSPKDEWQQYVNIQSILKSIQKLEAPLQRKRKAASTSSDNRLANIEKFYQWAKDNGAECDGLEIKKFPDYDLGLVATRDIKKGDPIFRIPRQLIMSEENLSNQFVLNYIKFSNKRLAFALMVESLKPESFWKPYIDLLPDSYNTVLYYTEQEMSELKGSNALSAALNLCKVIARFYVNIFYWPETAMPFEGFREVFNYDLLRWAVSTVMTRENHIPRSKPLAEETSPSIIAALIPFWDMANHRNGIISSFFNVETQEMESKAQEDCKKGEQVFIHYGDRSNAELMIHNGFINPDNPKDSVAIKIGLNTSDPLYEKRNKLLQLLNRRSNDELKVLPPPRHISPELMCFVRIFNMKEEQLDHWIESNPNRDLLFILEMELKSWEFLVIRLMLLLRAFPTSLEDDEKLFEGLKKGEIKPERNYIQMMILQYRILEKRILTEALNYAKLRAVL